MRVVRSLGLVVVKVKQCRERSQIFHVSNSGLKQRSECSRRFDFNSSEERECSERSQ